MKDPKQSLNEYLEQEARNEMQKRKVRLYRKALFTRVVQDTLSITGYALTIAVLFVAAYGFMLVMPD